MNANPQPPYHAEKWTVIVNSAGERELWAAMGSNEVPFGFGSRLAMERVCEQFNIENREQNE